MRLTFVTDLGQSFLLEIDPSMELENVMALLEAESGIAVADQSISHEGRELSDPSATITGSGLSGEDVVLLLRRKLANPTGGAAIPQDAETMRLQLLGNPSLMQEIRETQPELADAVQNNPQKFVELLRQTQQTQYAAEMEQQREIERLNADPFDVEAQRKIEESIRQQAVLENMQHAFEYSPETFVRVNMLYIPVEVNGRPVSAFVDSGAQSTIMSPECAEACGIMRLIDKRYEGIARGVGTAKIFGRVHSVQLKVADIFLPCAITIMEGRDVDLLFGLDMLKAHQACIDLGSNSLKIGGREVKFLSEHELPEKARNMGMEPVDAEQAGASKSASSSQPQQTPFPGGGHSLGSSPAARIPPRATGGGGSTNHASEDNIKILMDLGATRELAISTLQAAAGNVDVAASLLF